ncbi:MAG: hypothetical protein AAGA68_08015 [Pseudomonadota bacterium]
MSRIYNVSARPAAPTQAVFKRTPAFERWQVGEDAAYLHHHTHAKADSMTAHLRVLPRRR